MNIKYIIKKSLSLLSFLFPYKTNMSATEADTILTQHHTCPKGNIFTKNNIYLEYDLQIIVPAYNVGPYIKDCLNSILNQKTKYKYQIIIVNDGSTDDTYEIINQFFKYKNIIYIEQENKGLASARNAALKNISASYVMFVDSDDIIPDDTIENMLDAAYEDDIDILQGNWFVFTGINDIKTSTKAYLGMNKDTLSGYAWGKLYKYNVLENFKFPDGFLYEDTPVSFILFAKNFKFKIISELVYGYRENPTSITHVSGYKKNAIDTCYITEKCLKEFSNFDLSFDQKSYETFLKQTIVNYERIRKQPVKVRKAVFIKHIELMNTYFENFNTLNDSLIKIERIFRKKQFIKYELFMLGR